MYILNYFDYQSKINKKNNEIKITLHVEHTFVYEYD
jgi:hypothetical protein